MEHRQPSIPHLPALDGLRGLAVAGVLAFHGGLGWAAGGFLGVSAFFTLSGFLITSLLLAEHGGAGRVDLRRFWARRARRLLPAALVALAGVVVFGLTTATPGQVRGLRADVVAGLGYVANWRFVLDGRSYGDLFSEPSPVQHFWSLAIEEQFYVAFPLLAAALLPRGRHTRRTRRPFTAVLVGLTAGSVALTVASAVGGGDPTRAYYGTDTRAAELLVGALLAVALARRPGWWRPERATRLLPGVAAALALVLVLGSWALVDEGSRWLYRGGFALHAVGVAVVIAGAAGRGPVRTLLSARPLRALGRISYGLYLYHWPIFLWLDAGATGLDGPALLAVRLAATTAAAIVSYHLVEEPIRRGRVVVAWRSWVVPPVAAAAVAASVVAATAELPEPELVFEAVSAAPPASTATTSAPVSTNAPATRPATATPVSAVTVPPAPARPARLLVVGDSVAQTLGRGFERWGARTGDAEVWNVGREFCGLFRGGGTGWNGEPTPEETHCDRVQRDWHQQVERFDPDYVVVLSTIWDQVARRLPEWDETLRPGHPRYDAHLLDSYLTAVDELASQGATVALLDPPCHLQDVEAHRNIGDLRRWLLPALERARPDTLRVVGLRRLLCVGERFEVNRGHLDHLRPDGLHFSDEGADWVADRLGPVILGLPRRQDVLPTS